MNDNKMIERALIDNSRFILMILVVSIHCIILNIGNPDINIRVDYPIFYYIQYVYGEILTSIAVPLFFIMSGYLFFEDGFTFQLYKTKFRKRLKSLMIPYLLWNVIALIFRIFVSTKMGGDIHNWETSDLLMAFWRYDGTTTPANSQLWFIRDLMLAFLISPIIYIGVKRLKWLFVISTFVIWAFDLFQFDLFPMDAICFVALGGLIKISYHDYLNFVHRMNLKCLSAVYIVLILIEIFTIDFKWNSIFHNFNILIGILCFVKGLYSLLLFRKTLFPQKIIETNFFIYCFHYWPCVCFQTIIIRYMDIPINNISLLVLYVSSIIMFVYIGIKIYSLMKKLCPATLSFLTGNRIK